MAAGSSTVLIAGLTLSATPATAEVYGNTCTLPPALSPLPFQLSPDIDGSASVSPDSDGDDVADPAADTVSVENLTADVFVPGSIISAGVSLGIVQPGATLNGTVSLTLTASNTTPADRVVQATGVALGTISGTFVDGNGDLTYDDPEDTVLADPISSTITFPTAATFTPTGAGPVAVREKAMVILVNVGFNVPITCLPGYTDPGPDGELNDDPETPEDEAADNGGFVEQTHSFVTVPVASGPTTTSDGSTTTGPTTTTTEATTTSTTGATTTTTEPTTTTTAPPVSWYLPELSIPAALECTGADASTVNLLNSLGDGSIALTAKVTSPAFVSPDQGEQFSMPFTWQLGLDPAVISTAESLGVQTITVSGAALAVGPSEGASGSDVVGEPPARGLTLAQAASFIEGPFSGSFTRTGGVGDPITFTVRPASLTAVVALGGASLTLNLSCTPVGPASAQLVDQEGTPPTPTTQPTDVLGSQVPNDVDCADVTGTTVVGSDDPFDLDRDGDGIGCEDSDRGALPRTGAPVAGLVLLALGTIDFGYLALTASRPSRRRAESGR